MPDDVAALRIGRPYGEHLVTQEGIEERTVASLSQRRATLNDTADVAIDPNRLARALGRRPTPARCRVHSPTVKASLVARPHCNRWICHLWQTMSGAAVGWSNGPRIVID